MIQQSGNQRRDTIDQISDKAQQITLQMQSNIDSAIQRNERLSVLSNKTEKLKEESDLFVKKATEVKAKTRKECCEAYASYLALLTIAGALIAIILLKFVFELF